MQYKGLLNVIERNAAEHRAVLGGKAQETRGQGTAEATVTLTLTEEGDATRGSVSADLALSGKAAAMGKGVIGSVTEQMMALFANNLQAMLAEADCPRRVPGRSAVAPRAGPGVGCRFRSGTTPPAATPTPAHGAGTGHRPGSDAGAAAAAGSLDALSLAKGIAADQLSSPAKVLGVVAVVACIAYWAGRRSAFRHAPALRQALRSADARCPGGHVARLAERRHRRPGHRREARSSPHPRLPGASMLVTAGGDAVGSVSGGCVEGAVYELATQVKDDGVPALVRYGISDDDAFAVGLTCGGIIDIFVEPVSRQRFAELDDVAAGHRGRAPGGGRHGHRTPGCHAAGTAPGRPAGRVSKVTWAPSGPTTPSATTPRAPRRRADRHPELRRRRRTAGHRYACLLRQLCPAAAHARLRRHRLRRGAGAAGRLPGLPGDGL